MATKPSAPHPLEGKRAPAFNLASSAGGKVRLSEFRGRFVALYFYPRDDTPGCTTEACDFRDAIAEFHKAGAVVLGVSPDGIDSHRKFIDRHNLPFPLLADPDHKTADAYGAWGEKNMYGKKITGLIRSTFLINPAGKVVRAWKGVRVKNHVAEVLEALRRAMA